MDRVESMLHFYQSINKPEVAACLKLLVDALALEITSVSYLKDKFMHVIDHLQPIIEDKLNQNHPEVNYKKLKHYISTKFISFDKPASLMDIELDFMMMEIARRLKMVFNRDERRFESLESKNLSL